ncbi:uncharacterized protein LY89DRAFT_713660 [Mollisia scopiformis]|uniref:Pentatricopeptide repeat domain-containing protein n=1 Tax=Mollisia scopiformis TaxID=149040 RepID=A0A194XTV8_MOLSC|nr:uncharacterized protein LY89DRAFT_713660 [Mollisia scopiformis]KUJ23137.1 hypothetical protein LY89DRAFT_713660 [Mollisia scopiformis]
MQLLWSRAAQARSSCRCSSCLHTATTLARRTTTAASKRRLKISDVFTACYSTILATAAFADAKVKEERRKEWDRLIEEVKTPSKRGKNAGKGLDGDSKPEIDDWEVQKSHGSTIEVAEVPFSSYKPVKDLSSTTRYSPLQDHSLDAWGLPPRTKVPPVGEKLQSLDWKLRNSTAERIVARDVDSIHQSGLDREGQFIDDMFDADLWNREPRTPLHIEKYEEMVMNLVNKILQESKVFSSSIQPEGYRALKIQQQLSEMAQRFVALDIGVSRVPTFNYDDIDAVNDQRKMLHHSIWALCFSASRRQTDINVTVAKICYNLLISTAPPSITTYNILLNEFLNLKRLDLAQIVVDSFFHESRFKPNKRTIRLILDHYRAKSDFEGFHDVIQRMRGTKGDMRIHMRQLFFLSEFPVKTWALNNNVIHRNGFLRQKAPRSRPVFNSLILGSLEFQSIRGAVRYARAALREGHAISAETLCAVIKRIVDKLDAYAGLSLLRAILAQWEDGSIVAITVYSKDLRYQINQLLLLCSINPTKPSSRTLPPRVSSTAISNLLWRMQLGTIADAIERSANFLLQLDACLGMSGLDFSYTEIQPYCATQDTAPQRLEWAAQISRKYTRIEKARRNRTKQAERQGWRFRLQVLEKMVDEAPKSMLPLEAEILEMHVVTRKIELQSLLVKTIPMDLSAAEKYVRALTTSSARPPLSAEYPMFQVSKSQNLVQDPISYLETKLFNSTETEWHRRLMRELHTTDSPSRRKALTMQRIEHIRHLLDRYLDPEAGQHVMALRSTVQKEPEELANPDSKSTQWPSKKRLPGETRIDHDGRRRQERLQEAKQSSRTQHESDKKQAATQVLSLEDEQTSVPTVGLEERKTSLPPAGLLPLDPFSKRIDLAVG